jgi:phosphate transport system substrate-binding protein
MSKGRRSPQQLLSIFVMILIARCTSGAATPTPSPQPQVTLTVSGSDAVSTLLSTLRPAFEADVPGYRLNILSGSGTGGGVAGVVDQILDIASIARPPSRDEFAKGLKYVQIEQTGVAFVVHTDVSVKNLTVPQVQDIFFGRIRNWSELGGQASPIVLYVRDEVESATILLRERVFSTAAFPASVAATLTSTTDMLNAVEGTPGAIGFAFSMNVTVQKKQVRLLTLNDRHPNSPNYPILQSLGIGFIDPEKVKPLTDWLTSEKGKAALAALGVITA